METNNIVEEKRLKPSRRQMIENICGYAAIFIVVMFIFQKELGWWRYVVGVVSQIALAGLYYATFFKFFVPKSLNDSSITTKEKVIYYTSIVAVLLDSSVLVELLPFAIGLNVVITILINFALTMLLCRNIAK